MTKTKNITMNPKFFAKFVDVVSDNSQCHSDILNFEEAVFAELSLKNAVLYMADQHSNIYSGEWKVAHCTRSDFCFYYLETQNPVEATNIKLNTVEEIDEPSYYLDGKVFGLLVSLYAYIFLYYAHIQRKNKSAAILHSTDGHTVKRRFATLAKGFFEEPNLHDINDNEANEIKAMLDFIETYTKEDYEA